jgi:hypothetical protein
MFDEKQFELGMPVVKNKNTLRAFFDPVLVRSADTQTAAK